jgi:SAM-dependent methyltransferase
MAIVAQVTRAFDRWLRSNGDSHLGVNRRVAYLALNRLHNAAPYSRLDPRLSIADFDSHGADRLDEVPGAPSPSRALCDLFWMQLPWAAIEREVGPLHVLDVGCGSGRYGVSLQDWSGQRMVRYVGVDAQEHPDWPRLASAHPYLEFRSGDAEEISGLIPDGTNLLISQSTLEHVADDIRCFDEMHTWVHRFGRSLLQIHLVPSQACLWTYLWHGYRQYTPRTLSIITERFADCSERMIVRLGGGACNALHYRFITWPLLIRRRGDRRDGEPAEYRESLRQAIVQDLETPQRSPAFYALLIHSNPRSALLGSAGPWRVASKDAIDKG